MTTLKPLDLKYQMINLLPLDAHFITTKGEVFTIPSSGIVAMATRPPVEESLLPHLVLDEMRTEHKITVDAYSPSAGVELGVDPTNDVPLLVPLAVAAAMRELGFKYAGPVYSPQMLVTYEKAPGGRAAPGLVHHRDLTASRDPMTHLEIDHVLTRDPG